MGIVVTVFSYAFGFGSLPAGFLADKVGSRRLVTLYLFGSGIFALCVWPVNTLLFYGIIMGVIGAFCSTYHPASNTLLSLTIREKGKAFGIHGIAGSVGVAIVPVLSAWIGSLFGWRAPHVVFGALGIMAGIYSLTIPRPIRSKPENVDSSGSEAVVFKIPYTTLIVFLLSATSLGLTYKGIMTFIPVYMGENVSLSFMNMDRVALGGTMATIALISGAAGQYFAGRLVDRFSAEKLYLGTVLLGTIFVFIMAMSKDLLLIVAAILYALFYFATQPIQNFLLAGYLPEHRRGLGYGIHFFMTFGVGSTAAAVSGYLADTFGLTSVFYAMGLCFILASALIGYLVIRTER
jgi:MFS family permease